MSTTTSSTSSTSYAARDAATAAIREAIHAAGIDPRNLYVQGDELAVSVADDEAGETTQLLRGLGWIVDPPEPVVGRMVLITAARETGNGKLETGEGAPTDHYDCPLASCTEMGKLLGCTEDVENWTRPVTCACGHHFPAVAVKYPGRSMMRCPECGAFTETGSDAR